MITSLYCINILINITTSPHEPRKHSHRKHRQADLISISADNFVVVGNKYFFMTNIVIETNPDLIATIFGLVFKLVDFRQMVCRNEYVEKSYICKNGISVWDKWINFQIRLSINLEQMFNSSGFDVPTNAMHIFLHDVCDIGSYLNGISYVWHKIMIQFRSLQFAV